MSTRVCEWCGQPESPGVDGVNDDAWCDVKGRRHRIVARLRPETGLGLTVKATAPTKNARSGFTGASKEQRAKNRDSRCLVCGELGTDPAHLLPRSLLGEDQEHPLATIPLCRKHHREFDNDKTLDLLPYEAAFSEEMAFAVRRGGWVTAGQVVTNTRWVPVNDLTEVRRLQNALGDISGMQSDGASAEEMAAACDRVRHGGNVWDDEPGERAA